MEDLQFSVLEILALIGMAQCVYVLVYMALRSGRISRGGLALAYFFVLGLAFFTEFAHGYIGTLEQYFYAQWFLWFMGPPLSVLLIIQIAQINQVPALRYYGVLAFIPFAFLAGKNIPAQASDQQTIITVFGILAGGLSLLMIWLKRDVLDELVKQKAGKERYWLILTLITMNVLFLFVMLFGLNPEITLEQIASIRAALGLGFIYLVSTSLFRIYPQAVRISDREDSALNADEQAIAKKVEDLLQLQKVYQEPTYSRTDLARECSTSETTISKIINVHFSKSFPQLVNEHRVEDAKRLLAETDANIKTIAEEVGFNSIASFNRVFKDYSGVTPSQYRKKAA